MPDQASPAILVRMNHRILTLAFCLAALSAAPGSAQEPAKGPRAVRPLKAGGSGTENFKISFKIRASGLESAGNFMVRDGAQSNYVRGGETPYEFDGGRGKSVEYKKHGTIVNCLPASHGDAVSLTCQFELSGALAPTGSLGARPIETFQLQSDFTIRRGETLALVDEPDRGIEITLETARPRAAK